MTTWRRAALVLGLLAGTAKSGWQRAIPDGRGCWQERCAEGQFPLALDPIVGAGGTLWMIGHRSVWFSTDGITWRRADHDGGWGERYGATKVFFAGRLWLMGGGNSWARFESDVWSSTDATQWVRVTTAPWPARRGHRTLVFGDRLWVLGGGASSGRVDATPTVELRDVWSSPDGVTWTRETGQAPWTTVECALVRVDRFWVLGAGDAWSSSDGRAWTRVARDLPALARRGGGCAVFKNQLWVFGGIGPAGVTTNDVWSSVDGREWRRRPNAMWSPRGAQFSVVFDDRVWVFGGKTGRADGFANDVWYLDPRFAL